MVRIRFRVGVNLNFGIAYICVGPFGPYDAVLLSTYWLSNRVARLILEIAPTANWNTIGLVVV